VATSIIITCPQCKKQSKGPTQLVGKTIRCKACGHTFLVKSASPNKPGPAAKAAKAKGLRRPADADEFEQGSNPYEVTDLDLTPRCPHCAGEMEEGAIVCLHCGYNTRTREHPTVVKVMGATFWEHLRWLLPGIACAIAVLSLGGLIAFLWVPGGLRGQADKDPQSWLWYFFDNFPTQVYGTVFSLGLMWLAGKFAFKRLVLHPKPPEKIKRG
jgi:DNA-directed RNA polymerase subunit RPC12/RpoP